MGKSKTRSKKLRWGILGVATINERLIPGFKKANLADLRAIASRDLEKARAAATRWDLPTAYGSYEALLADEQIDAVYIPLPNHLHDEWARAAADAGKHILCEKPLTPHPAEALSLHGYCLGKKVQLMEGFMWPHHPRTAKIREAIDQGKIGQVVRVAGSFTFRLPPDPANIRLQAEAAGGSLLDVGCYPVYGIRWAFGAEPARAFAAARYEHGVDVEMSGLVWLEDGRVGAFDCGFTTPMRQWLEVTGTEAVIRVADMWLPDETGSFTVERDGRDPEVVSVPGHDQIVCMLDNFSRAVLDGTYVRPGAVEAIRTLRVLHALASAAEEGAVVET